MSWRRSWSKFLSVLSQQPQYDFCAQNIKYVHQELQNVVVKWTKNIYYFGRVIDFDFNIYRKREVERSRNAKLSRKHVSDVPRDQYMEEDVDNQNQHDPAQWEVIVNRGRFVEVVPLRSLAWNIPPSMLDLKKSKMFYQIHCWFDIEALGTKLIQVRLRNNWPVPSWIPMMLNPIAMAVLNGRHEANFWPWVMVSYSELIKNQGKKNPK